MTALRTGIGVVTFQGTLIGAPNYLETPLDFDTTGLVLTGIPVYLPEPGDLLAAVGFDLPTTAWDGTTPQLNVYSAGDDPDTQAFAQVDLSATGTPVGTHAVGLRSLQNVNAVFQDDTPVMANVDDTAGGDPGSAQGEGTLILVVVPAS